MSKASKARKKERRMAELAKIQGLESRPSVSVSSPESAPVSELSPTSYKLQPTTSSAEFAHVKMDLVKIAIVILLVVGFYTTLTLVDNQTNFLQEFARSIFRFLQLPV